MAPELLSHANEEPPVPRCFQCQKPVERFEWWYDAAYEYHRYVAYCHGAQQSWYIERELLFEQDLTVSVVWCFAPEGVLPPPLPEASLPG